MNYIEAIDQISAKTAATFTSVAEREKHRMMGKNYRLTHSFQQKKRARKYARKKKLGYVPRQRIQVGRSYVYTTPGTASSGKSVVVSPF